MKLFVPLLEPVVPQIQRNFADELEDVQLGVVSACICLEGCELVGAEELPEVDELLEIGPKNVLIMIVTKMNITNDINREENGQCERKTFTKKRGMPLNDQVVYHEHHLQI